MTAKPRDPISRFSVDSTKPKADQERRFDGRAAQRRITIPGEAGRARVSSVSFEDGARTKWHQHRGVQVLAFVAGVGEVESSTGQRIVCEPGDVVRVEAYVKHRHGAVTGKDAHHLAFTFGESCWEGDDNWPCEPDR